MFSCEVDSKISNYCFGFFGVVFTFKEVLTIEDLGKSMGSILSGRCRTRKITADTQFSIDIGMVIRQCPITEGQWLRRMHWSRFGEQIGSCGIRVKRDSVRPIEITILVARNGEPTNQQLQLVHQAMPKGGVKTFAVCPYCKEKKLKLYLCERERICCRACAGFTYMSCQKGTKPLKSLEKYTGVSAEPNLTNHAEVIRHRNMARCKEYRRRLKGECQLRANLKRFLEMF